MPPEPKHPSRLTFGPFEVDMGADELLKGGTRIRLPGQPFQILLTLLERPGVVVTREELREKIWADGTFVDFEHGLNAAINKLRRALGDSADNPRYIETVPGRGYRFIGNLEQRRSPALTIASAPLVFPGPAGGDELQEPDDRTVAAEVAVTTARKAFLPAPVFWVLIFVVGVLGMWTVDRLLKGPPARTPEAVVQFLVSSPPGAIFSPPIARQSFAISPDGTRLAFIATGSAHPGIWIRELASADPRPVAGTEGAWTVFWSPDSRSIFFSVQRAIRQTNLETNTTHTVATLPAMAMFGTWLTPEDLLLYVGPTNFFEVSTRTGEVKDVSGASLRWPESLPDSDRFLHVAYDPALSHYRAFAADFKTKESTPLMETDSRVEYAPPLHAGEPGDLLFIRGGSLVAQPFDAGSLKLIGAPFPIAQNVTHFSPSASGCFSVSRNGVLVYQVGSPASELRWYDRSGHIVSKAAQAASFNGSVRASPDGQRAVAQVWSVESGGSDMWVFDGNGRESRRLTYPPAVHVRPIWSPDGKRIAFGSSQTGAPRVTALTVDGDGKEEVLIDNQPPGMPWGQIQAPTDWSRDGRFIVYDDSLGEEERQVWLLEVATHKMMPLLQNGSSEWGGAFSPDGKQIAYISDDSGKPEAYVQGFEASPTPHLTGARRQVSRESAWLVRWRPDGREIFYVGLDSKLYASELNHGEAGEPKFLFEIPGNPQSGTASDFQFDVSSNGQQFVMTTVGSAAPPDFVVIQNWQARFHH